MILWPQADGSVLATPQPAHALISGQLMRALAEPPAPFEAVCTAAAQHDCPWMPWEAAPDFDPETGLPMLFTALPGTRHVPMWEEGVRVALANWGLWVGLLVLLHGTHIYRRSLASGGATSTPGDASALEAYIAREPAWSAAIMRELGVTEAQVRPQQQKLAMVDGIALALCWGKVEFGCGPTTLRRSGDFSASLDPWPLAPDSLTVTTEARRLPARFPDAASMRAGLAGAPVVPLSFTLHRA